MTKTMIKNLLFIFFMITTFGLSAYCQSTEFAGGSFSASAHGTRTLQNAKDLAQVSFCGYGYASLSEILFIGGFGKGFGGKDITSGYGGLALGLWIGRGDRKLYLLNLLGVGLLGYRDVPYFGAMEEISINYGIFLSERFMLSFYMGLNVQANLSDAAFRQFFSFAPALGCRIDFGRYNNIATKPGA